MKHIVEKFAITGDVLEIKPLGNGLINGTFIVKTTGPDYVLQWVNHKVFTDVPLVQRNIENATSHIRKKLEMKGETDIDRKVLTLVPLKDGSATFIFEGEHYWRVLEYVTDSVTLETVTPETSFLTGLAFGEWEDMLSDCEAPIGESIPDFHNMELRIRQLKDAVANDAAGRVNDAEVREMISFFAEHEKEMCKAEDLYRAGLLQKRICHCDTKLSNILFDKDGKVLCVIDLDTMMPSFIFSDFGDFMRTAGSTLPEDDPAIEKVAIRMDIFREFARGYVKSAKFLTDVEKENLPYATLRFSYMQGVRFFADYLNGDTYYHIDYPEHNLVRTRNQIALFKSQLEHLPEMQAFVAELL